MAEQEHLENANIAGRLESLGALLELAGANPYAARAYRRGAALIRESKVPVADLIRAGRVRELPGIGPGIEARLLELVETGEIAELEELERTLPPELIAFGRSLGLSAARTLGLARALGVRTPDELRAAARDGRLRTVPGIGPKREAELLERLERPEIRPPARRLLLSDARALTARIAEALSGVVAGDVRRWHDEPERLAIVVAAKQPAPALDRFAGLPEILAVVERSERRTVGLTVDGIAVELVVAHPDSFGTELLRATGSARYVRALEPLPEAPTEEDVFARLRLAFCPPELREDPFRGDPPQLVQTADLRGDLHCHTTWSDGRGTVEEMALAARAVGYEYLAICDHTPAVSVVRGLTADDLRRQALEIADMNERLAPFRVLRGVECDILENGALDLPDTVLAELDWVQVSVHRGQRAPQGELTKRVEAALRNPYVRCLSHPTGRLIGRRPANALDLERVLEMALETGVALEVNGLPDRLDLRGEHVRLAVEGGVPIVCSTDAHSVAGLGNMELAVGTARRGFAMASDVLNTQPLASVLRGRAPLRS